jgi:hypothetical protein
MTYLAYMKVGCKHTRKKQSGECFGESWPRGMQEVQAARTRRTGAWLEKACDPNEKNRQRGHGALLSVFSVWCKVAGLEQCLGAGILTSHGGQGGRKPFKFYLKTPIVRLGNSVAG